MVFFFPRLDVWLSAHNEAVEPVLGDVSSGLLGSGLVLADCAKKLANLLLPHPEPVKFEISTNHRAD